MVNVKECVTHLQPIEGDCNLAAGEATIPIHAVGIV